MNADEFANELWKCAPPKEKLEARGLSPVAIDRRLRAYRCGITDNPVKYADPLLDLVDRHDMSSVEIGMIAFFNAPKEVEYGWSIGYVEADPLVIDKVNGEVYVEEYDTNGHRLWSCAENSGKFLDAILLMACYLGSGFEPETLESFAKANECASAAGGEKYINFYLMLMGM